MQYLKVRQKSREVTKKQKSKKKKEWKQNIVSQESKKRVLKKKKSKSQSKTAKRDNGKGAIDIGLPKRSFSGRMKIESWLR